MRRGRLPLGLTCPGCGSDLEPLGEGAGEVHRLYCPACGETFKARRRTNPPAVQGPQTVGGLSLAIRAGLLRMVPPVYHTGVGVGTAILVVSGGFIPVIRGWLADRIAGWGGVIEAMGGARVVSESRDPDNDFGPILRRLDAPGLFEEVAEVARRLGVRPPEEIRLAFLPCCGVVAWRRSRALLLGLPLLEVLTLAELRAILAHELAHLARGDATWAAGSLRFVEGLGRALDDPNGRAWGPLRLWARLCRKAAGSLIGPIARGQEARADRTSANLAGGPAAASALIKVALVQPLFRELLGQHDPDRSADLNLYASFRALWVRLPVSLLEAMRLRLLTLDPGAGDSPHPPLPDRVAMVQAFPDRPDPAADSVPVVSLLGDPEWLEQMLYDRLFALPTVEPTIFHKAGT
jgi:Zn-dependent protease with chaperone function